MGRWRSVAALRLGVLLSIFPGLAPRHTTHLFDPDFRRARPDRDQQLNGYQPSPENILFCLEFKLSVGLAPIGSYDSFGRRNQLDLI